MQHLLERAIARRNEYRDALDKVVLAYKVPDEYVVWDVKDLRGHAPHIGSAWIGCGAEAWPIKDGPYPGPDDTVAYLSGDTLLIFERESIK